MASQTRANESPPPRTEIQPYSPTTATFTPRLKMKRSTSGRRLGGPAKIKKASLKTKTKSRTRFPTIATTNEIESPTPRDSIPRRHVPKPVHTRDAVKNTRNKRLNWARPSTIATSAAALLYGRLRDLDRSICWFLTPPPPGLFHRGARAVISARWRPGDSLASVSTYAHVLDAIGGQRYPDLDALIAAAREPKVDLVFPTSSPTTP
jgi:hypothetical protein